jgi:Fur family transcriptional regulator, ferric uptake regulator
MSISSESSSLSTRELKALFNQSGQRFTAQREAVWQLFVEHPKGLTIAQATTVLTERKISQTTVYRTVNTLQDMGYLRWVHNSEGEHCYLVTRPGHTHMLVCRQCARAVECNDCDLSVLEQLIARKTDFTVEGHHLEFYGICPDCR